MSIFPVLLAYHLVARHNLAPIPLPAWRPPRVRHVPDGWRPLPDEDAWLLPNGQKVTGNEFASWWRGGKETGT